MLELLPFVHSNLPAGNRLYSRGKLPGSHGAILWLLKATATIEFAPADDTAWLACWLKRTHRSNAAAVAGGSQLRRNDRPVSVAGASARNSRFLSLAEGRRGTQERNCTSTSFMSLICCSFHRNPQFLHAITVAARSRVGRDAQQRADALERVFVPYF